MASRNNIVQIKISIKGWRDSLDISSTFFLNKGTRFSSKHSHGINMQAISKSKVYHYMDDRLLADSNVIGDGEQQGKTF